MTLPKKPPSPLTPDPFPLTSADFEKLMGGLPLPNTMPRFAVAVSGGPDSLALTLFLKAWIEERQGALHAFTVDHRLRPESTQEAQKVQRWLSAQGVAHSILTWDHEATPVSAIHARARTARYDLLIDACHTQGCTHLFLAQHADDQAETVLMRFAKGSGLDGLAGMASLRTQDDIELVRPLLPVRKSRLVASCAAYHWPYINDPSNESARFARARLRDMHNELAREGLTTERLYEIARTTGQIRAHLESLANQWVSAHARADGYGRVLYEYAAWSQQPEDMRGRLLARALQCVSGDDYAPRLTALDLLQANLCRENFSVQTLSGCLVERYEGNIVFQREEALVTQTLALDGLSPRTRWDNRFTFTFSGQPDLGLCIRKLGSISRDQLEKRGFAAIAALPAKTRASLPALYHGDDFAGLPEFDQNRIHGTVVQAHFLPRRALILKPFCFCPPLFS